MWRRSCAVANSSRRSATRRAARPSPSSRRCGPASRRPGSRCPVSAHARPWRPRSSIRPALRSCSPGRGCAACPARKRTAAGDGSARGDDHADARRPGPRASRAGESRPARTRAGGVAPGGDAGRQGCSPEEMFSAMADEVARLSEADTAMVLRYETDGFATVVGGWGDRGGSPRGRGAADGGGRGRRRRGTPHRPVGARHPVRRPARIGRRRLPAHRGAGRQREPDRRRGAGCGGW